MNKKSIFFVGTYSDSIHVMELVMATGAVSKLYTFRGLTKSSYLTVSKDNKYLYTAGEGAKGTGGVHSFKIEQDKSITKLNSQLSNGAGPCYVAISNCCRYLLSAGYSEGTLNVYPIMKNGSLDELSFIEYHHGNSIDVKRQSKPHVHCVMPLKGTGYVYAADLGLDKILIYKLMNGKLSAAKEKHIDIHPGAGPRHMAVSNCNNRIYLVNELDSTVTVLSVNAATGKLTIKQDISSLPADFKKESWSSAIRLSPDTHFLYVSNRGHDSIAVFKVAAGLLETAGFIPTAGRCPRDFNIDPSGKYMIIANQDSNSIRVYKLNKQNGLGEYTGHSLRLKKPACIVFENQ